MRATILPLQHQASRSPLPAAATCHPARPARRHARAHAATKQPSPPPDATKPSSSDGASAAEAALAAIASTSAGGDAPKLSPDMAQLAESLMANPETAAQLKRYEAALAQLEANKAAAAELEVMYAKAARELAAAEAQEEAEMRLKADEIMAAAEVAAAEKMLMSAELDVAVAAELQRRAGDDVERKDSAKAGGAAGLAGLVFCLPTLLFSQASGPEALASAGLGLGATVVSCFLFGVTYRYVVRQDASNRHLQGGAVGAFGLVRAAAAADVLQATSSAGVADVATVVGPAALYAGESMLVFAFAAAAVEKAFDAGLVRRFGAPRGEPQKGQ